MPFFLDQAVLSAWLDRAQKRDAALKTFFAEGRDRISIAFTPTNSGWIGAVSLPEPALGLDYRFGAGSEFRPTGFQQIADPRTGRPLPKSSIEFPPQTAPVELALRYTDANGLVSPVTTLTFEPRAALQRGQRENLERIAPSWLAYGTGQNSHRLYASTLIAYRCAIEKVEIGFNGARPQEAFPLPPCDFANPGRMPPEARHFIELKPTIESVTLRLTFVGGDTSDVKTFPRPSPR